MSAAKIRVCFFAIASCAAPSSPPTSPTVAVEARDAAGSAPDTVEVFDLLPVSAETAKGAELTARTNGALAYDPRSPESPWHFRDILTAAHRTTALGPKKTVTETDALARAKAFMERCGDLFGVSRAELDKLDVSTHPESVYTAKTSPNAVLVWFKGQSRQPGYDAFENTTRYIDVNVYVQIDGEIGFVSASGVDFPILHLRTKPKLAANDPAVVSHVIGQPLYMYRAVGGVAGTYTTIYKRTRVRTVSASDVDVRNIVPVLSGETTTEPLRITRRLLYQVRIPNPNPAVMMDEIFLVDPDTGALVQAPPAASGVVQD